jgi:hypothetical protein
MPPEPVPAKLPEDELSEAARKVSQVIEKSTLINLAEAPYHVT